MYQKLTLKDIMTTPVLTVPPTTSINDAMSLMVKHHLSSIIIVENETAIGIFTEHDVLGLNDQKINLKTTPISSVMSSPLCLADETTDFSEGYRTIAEKKIRHLGVSDASGHITGIVSESDFVLNLSNDFLVGFKNLASVMSHEIVSIPFDQQVSDALDVLKLNRSSYVVITEGQKPLGILTERDIIRLRLNDPNYTQRRLTDVMSQPLITLPPETLLPEALKTMEERSIRRLVVVDSNSDLVGILGFHEVVSRVFESHLEDLMLVLECYEREHHANHPTLHPTIQANQELSDTKQRLNTILNTLPYGIHECDSNGVITYCNRAYSDLLGSNRESIIGQPAWDLSSQEDERQNLKDTLRNILDNQPAPIPYSTTHIRTDGSKVILAVVWNYLRRADGQIDRLIFIVSDITRQSKVEQNLLNRQLELEQIFKALPVALVYADKQRRITKVNPAFTTIFGYRPDEVINKKTSILYASYEEFLEQGRQRFSAQAHPTNEAYEIEYRRKNGDVFISRTVGTPVRDSKGEVVGMLGLVEDITNEKKATEYKQLASTIIENTSEGIFVTDPSGSIVEVNQAFQNITGYSKEEIIGANPRVLKSGHHDFNFYQNLWQSIQNQGHWKGEVWNRRKDGSIYPEWQQINAVRDGNGELTHYISIFSDITSRKQSKEALERLTHYDALTSLPNRLLLLARIDQAIQASKYSGAPLCLICLDIDHFKNVNDSLGHTMGDKALMHVANLLQASIGPTDCVARTGGDEFIILVENMQHPELADIRAQSLLDAFKAPIVIDQNEILLSASIGVCVSPQDGCEKYLLLRNVDSAMYQAKKEGRNTFRFYTEDLTSQAIERHAIDNQLKRAIERNELRLYYQPQICLKTGTLVGYEALLRWFNPDLGQVPPSKFIPIAEEAGLIQSIGNWVLNTACNQARQWLSEGVDFHKIAVNVSGLQIQHGNFVGQVKQALKAAHLPAQYLEIELTESFIMQHDEKAIMQLQELRELGLTVSIDDFGTGYSSLSYLKKLPVNKIKIDKSFVDDIPNDSESNAIAEAIIALAKVMNFTVIAEGIENKGQAHYLLKLGCEQAQGFLYSKPVPPDILS